MTREEVLRYFQNKNKLNKIANKFLKEKLLDTQFSISSIQYLGDNIVRIWYSYMHDNLLEPVEFIEINIDELLTYQ